MINKDLHTLYAIFDHCQELTFNKVIRNNGISIFIDEGNVPTDRNTKQIIADALFSLELDGLGFFLVSTESLSIFRCKDDNALKFTLSLQYPGEELFVNGSITVDSDLPKDKDFAPFAKLMIRLKSELAAKVIIELKEIFKKENSNAE